MKILVFSDTHLRSKFEKSKYNFLKKIITPVDRVIINGDFWDGYEMQFDQFITSPWKRLFPLLKEKQAIYLYGNHDSIRFTDQQAKIFSAQQVKHYRMKVKDKILIFEHGNRVLPFWDEDPSQLRTPKGLFMKYLAEDLQNPLIKVSGARGHKYFGHFQNNIIKKRILNSLQKDEVYVCGHTHAAEFDPDNQFINSGLIRYGIAQYLLIENGDMVLKEEKYS